MKYTGEMEDGGWRMGRSSSWSPGRVVPQSHLNATDRIYGEPVKENKFEVKDNILDHLNDKPGVEVDIMAAGREAVLCF